MKKSFISINAAKTCGHVSDTLFGLFWEDINNCCDGGINANMVRNYSFDDRYLKERKLNEFIDLTMGRIKNDEHLKTEVDPLRFWNCIGGKLTAATEDPVSRNSGYVSIAVKGIAKDIHPKKKRPVGARLALLARGKIYGENILCEAPEFRSVEVQDGKLLLSFANAGSGLEIHGKKLNAIQITVNGKPVKHSKVSAKGDSLQIRANEIKQDSEVEIQFAWTGYCEVNLYNSAGLSAKPFRFGQGETMGSSKFLLQKIWGLAEKQDKKRLADIKSLPGIRCEKDIAYSNDGDPMHQLNLYWPEDAEDKIPTIIDIHGGGWMYGDKDLNRPYCEYLASKGFRVMGMSYRLLPHTDLQGIIQDIFASIHWLEAHAQEYGFDLGNVLLTGDSAGGHLTSLVMCIQQSEHLQEIYGVKPFGFELTAAAICNGVCEMHDIYAFTGFLCKGIDKKMQKMLLGNRGVHAPWNGYMNFSQVIEKAKSLPLMVISSESDPFYIHIQWLLDILKKNQWPCETVIWKKEDGKHLGHVFQIANPEWEESKITNGKMLEFFRKAIGLTVAGMTVTFLAAIVRPPL